MILASVLVVGLGVALLWQPVQWDRAIDALHVEDLGPQVSTTRNLLPDLPSGCRVYSKTYQVKSHPYDLGKVLQGRMRQRFTDVEAVYTPKEGGEFPTGSVVEIVGHGGGQRTPLVIDIYYWHPEAGVSTVEVGQAVLLTLCPGRESSVSDEAPWHATYT